MTILTRSRSSFDDDPGARLCCTARTELLAHLGGDAAISCRMGAVGLRGDDWRDGVRGLADLHVQRHLAQERHPQSLRLAPRTAMAEDVVTRAAVRADERA